MIPFVIGHAGDGRALPENSLAGVLQSLREGADAIEIDVHLAADGVPVLMHDATLERTTDGTGRVAALTSHELARVRLANGEPVPTLASVLEHVQGRLVVMCELKVDDPDAKGDDALVAAVLECIERHAAHSWTAVHAFNGGVVRASRERDPRVSAALIVPNQDIDGMRRMLGATLRRHAQAISVQQPCITREHVLEAKRRQVTLWCWSTDDEADWARLLDAGVDGIMTDRPAALREFASQRHRADEG